MSSAPSNKILWENSQEAIFVGSSYKKNQIKLSKGFNAFFETRKSTLKSIVSGMRFHQWSKNILIFIPTLCAHQFFHKTWDTILAFLAMSLVASAGYLLNDCFDVENDRKHPTKKHRPIPTGELTLKSAVIWSGVLLALSLGLSFFVSTRIPILMLFYFSLSLLYTLYLKKIPIVDLSCLSFFYIWRIIIGSNVTETTISSWFL